MAPHNLQNKLKDTYKYKLKMSQNNYYSKDLLKGHNSKYNLAHIHNHNYNNKARKDHQIRRTL